MSKKLKRSAVALVLAATMVFSSQGVLTAFAVGENETSTAVDVSALGPILDKEETVVVEGPGNTDETETPEVTESCDKTEGCTLSKGHDGECVTEPVTPPEEENGENETQPCTKTEGCTLENGHEGECVTEPVTPPEEENGEDETQPCEKTEGCTLPNGHEGECVVEENTEDTEDTQEPSEEDVAAVQAVVDVINSLPTTDDLANYTPTIELKPEDEGYQEAYQAALDAYYSQVQEKVKAARAAYDALTEEQKAAFDATVLAKLTALEELIAMREQADVLPNNGDKTLTVSIDGDYPTVQSAINYIDLQEDKAGWTIEIQSGTYDRFVVLPGLNDLTVKAADDASVVINTLNGSVPDGVEFNGGWPDTYGISIRNATNITIDSLTINVGQNSDWHSSGISTYSEHTEKADQITIVNCNFKGSGENSAFLVGDIHSYTIENCNFSGFDHAIYFLADNANVGNITITNNHFSDCNFAIHGYFGKPNGGSMNIANNTFVGTDSLRTKVVLEDQHNNGAFSVSFIGNTLDNALIGAVNLNGEINNVLSENQLSTNSFFVEGSIDENQVELSSAYHADKIDGYRVKWVSTGIDIPEENKEIIEKALQEHQYDNPLQISPLADGTFIETFTWFKDAIYLDREEVGALSITKTVSGSEANSNDSFDFQIEISQTNGIPLNDSYPYTYSINDGESQPLNLDENGKAVLQLKDGETALIQNIPVGYKYTITEIDSKGYTVTSLNASGIIEQGETSAVTFNNHKGSGDPSLPTNDWDTSKSKTATNLDENYESKVTLSLPSAEEQLESDVVFVLDKSTSTDIEKEALTMLDNLQKQIADTNAKVKVGVVIFNKEANSVLELTELTEENMDEIQEAFAYTISGGTNTHAGLLAGKAMLDNDPLVDASRKYLVFVSDAITYMYNPDSQFNSEPTAISLQNGDKTNNFAGPDNWATKYGNTDMPQAGWEQWLGEIGSLIVKDNGAYDIPYAEHKNNATYIPYDERSDHAMSIDKALYLTNQVYQEIQQAGYHCYAMKAYSDAADDYPWASCFMDYLANGQEVSFEDIQNDIFYLLDEGSSVVDVIGYGKDDSDNEYNFDFVDNLDNLKITVGGNELDKEDIIDPQFNDPYVTSAYGFYDPASGRDGYDFVLKYYQKGQDGNSDECFVWEINVPVSNFAPVQLTYTVKLTNPQTAEGTYGEYDANGENGSTSLYTNKEATLYPVDSNGDSGVPENFPKPTVSYTVGGNDNPGTDPTPDPDPDPDRPSRPNRGDDDDWEPLPDAPVKDKPTTEVDVPEETETPTTEQPDKYNPETGDTTTVFAAMALAAVSLGGVVLLGRKKK